MQKAEGSAPDALRGSDLLRIARCFTACCLLLTARCLLPTASCLLPAAYCLLFLMRSSRLVEAHAEAQTHALEDFLDLVERLAAEVLRLQHLGLGLLHQLANRPDVRVLQAVVGADRELQLLDALVEIFVQRPGARRISGRFGGLVCRVL